MEKVKDGKGTSESKGGWTQKGGWNGDWNVGFCKGDGGKRPRSQRHQSSGVAGVQH